ncbi:MAG: UDP-N-acetylmuramoyl-L-alanine--D-glutamate ligase [Candidatus Buchananbacteria bacterium CG10_big_fil_rev_8_21_14_0_10_42_9]|uniref:UDP-N-acetylmuramoylalanine--D-glutamate ligase n=1 Tax=Candidatus Buchananbacteria bacterium CG10_big_fil_rev_8_21_14_0_10_42_9 TaxID=1974526 RepID=A0A2H0W2K0_9BACT|nr:MAG: UDP-N-acetylmuramoyl-L-alanine--D-glutamate ligase [Candidatus Buchananbacteria bacterium CG10_big_fil_rev_8_21_14_0_10_42_9]
MKRFKNKKITVMGLGLHGGGLAVTRWLAERGADLTVTDLKSKSELKESLDKLKKYKNIKLILGRHRNADFVNCEMVIRNPAVPNNSKYLALAKKSGAVVHNEASLFFSLINSAKIIGITGTRGKSTTASLLGNILKKHGYKTLVAGNIGTSAMFDNYYSARQADFVVLELSSWHLEDMHEHKQSPHIAIITNLFPEHLNRYASYSAYKKAKAHILAWQSKKDMALINYDNNDSRQLGKLVLGKRIWLSRKFLPDQNAIFIKSGNVKLRLDGRESNLLSLKIMPSGWQLMLANYLAAMAAARILNVSPYSIRRGIKTFKGVPHRLEFIGDKDGVKFYNDSAASSPEATILALRALGGRTRKIILIAGGSDKKLNFTNLAKEIKKFAKAVVLFQGEGGTKLRQALKRVKMNSPIKTNQTSMQSALKNAMAYAKPGDIVLLSPACASFGLFTNEFDRGRQFVGTVKSL